MPCYHPIDVYRSLEGPKNGKWPIVFNVKKGYHDKTLKIPCGKCIGCRLERSRQWATRCVLEAQMHSQNCFITLTFNDEHLVDNYSLNKEDFQLFMKRLRKKYGPKIKYYHCGEYGELLQRPHHHACIFGLDFPDKKLHSVRNGIKLYKSELLSKLWTYGFSTVGEVTFQSAAYVARYINKKILGENEKTHYGELEPEYTTMSRRPGIGKTWLERYKTDVYPKDTIHLTKDLTVRPPKYYDYIYDQENHSNMERIKRKRKKFAQIDPKYLIVQEQNKLSQLKKLHRGVEKCKSKCLQSETPNSAPLATQSPISMSNQLLEQLRLRSKILKTPLVTSRQNTTSTYLVHLIQKAG